MLLLWPLDSLEVPFATSYVSVGRGSRQSTSLRPQGAKAPEEPLTACRVGGWLKKIVVVVYRRTKTEASIGNRADFDSAKKIMHENSMPSASSMMLYWSCVKIPFSFFRCLPRVSSRYSSSVRVLEILWVLVASPEDVFVRGVRFSCGVLWGFTFILPFLFSVCFVSCLSEGRVFFSPTYDPSSFCVTV